jgi:alkanesulfonate monooxygenase SsuD/methylene tetrahydromethanopterin reductase-like flavin-dependent oxidoreductase (luciferase family)
VHCSILASPAHVRRVRASTSSARGDFKVIAYVPVALSDHRDEARAWMRPMVARYLGALHGQSILDDAGLGTARTQPFRDALTAGRVAGELVTDEILDAVAIAGTAAECRRALVRWAQAGLDSLVAVVPEAAEYAGQIERIGRDLSPAWKELRCR